MKAAFEKEVARLQQMATQPQLGMGGGGYGMVPFWGGGAAFGMQAQFQPQPQPQLQPLPQLGSHTDPTPQVQIYPILYK